MKKWVIVGPAHPLRGGIAALNERLAQALATAKEAVRIESFSLQYPDFLFPGKTQYSDSPPPKYLHINTSINAISPLNWWKVGNKIARERPDCVIFRYWLPFMSPCLGTIARLVRRNGHTVVLCIADNILPHEKHLFDTSLTRYFVSAIDGFLSMSQSVLDDLALFDTTKPRTLSPHPLYDHFGEKMSRSEALARLQLPNTSRYLLFFGLIRDYKGLDILLDAFATLHTQYNSVKLIVAGEFYTDSSPYLKQIAALGLEEHVILHDRYIPDEDVAPYFCVADMVVQPYKHATQSGVTQIAYHFERPMLVTRVGGLSEMVPDGKVGYVVTPSPQAVATALVDFYEHQRSNYFEQNVADEKQRYTWDKMVAALESLYQICRNKKTLPNS